MDYEKLISNLAKAVAQAKSGGDRYFDVPCRSGGLSGSNQFLFFLKPELTQSTDRFYILAGFVLSKLEEFHFSIESASVVSGEYLAKHNVISSHYGVIDTAARLPEASMTGSMWQTFEETFKKSREEVRVVGGIPYLAGHQELDAATLALAWLERGFTKLGSGTYCQYIDKEDLYLVNGFYPRLLNHFTRPGSCIVCFVIRGASSWSVARREFAGATTPEKAMRGSVRNNLLVRKEEFGLPEVSTNLNGVHLSAGPLEGVVEIMRFSARQTKLGDLIFGKMLEENFSKSEIDLMLLNGSVTIEAGVTTFFDLTEELDSADAVQAMKEALR